MSGAPKQLVCYIAPGAPATRWPAEGDEPIVRPELGFTPTWYRQHLNIDLGRRWHTDPAYRRETVVAMRGELQRRFPGTRIGSIDRPDMPLDLLTGAYGACSVAAIYGVPVIYAEDNWPTCGHQYLHEEEFDRLEPPDLATNPFFRELIDQFDWIADREGRVEGYINWQGMLNIAQRLRGQRLFMDMVDCPHRVRRLFDCVTTNMIDAAKRLHARQSRRGMEVTFFTVSNCLVNMISPKQYSELLLPFDIRIADAFGQFGVHNCAWTADPYVDHYATVPHLGYIDTGVDSDLRRASDLFPDARRAIIYTPMDLVNESLDEIHGDFRRIARDYGPCDIAIADIEAGTPDERGAEVIEMCRELNEPKAKTMNVKRSLGNAEH